MTDSPLSRGEQLPPAQVRMVPVFLVGTALFLVALAVSYPAGWPPLARNVILAGIAFGLGGTAWARGVDRRHAADDDAAR